MVAARVLSALDEGLPRVKHPKAPFQSFTCLPRPETAFYIGMRFHWHNLFLLTQTEAMEEDLKE